MDVETYDSSFVPLEPLQAIRRFKFVHASNTIILEMVHFGSLPRAKFSIIALLVKPNRICGQTATDLACNLTLVYSPEILAQ